MTDREAAVVQEVAEALEGVLVADGHLGKSGEWQRRWARLGRAAHALHPLAEAARRRKTSTPPEPKGP